MNRLFALSVMACVAMAISGIAAADNDQDNQQAQIQQVADPAAGGATASQREWEYLAALQKCERFSGEERTHCVEEVRKIYGEM